MGRHDRGVAAVEQLQALRRGRVDPAGPRRRDDREDRPAEGPGALQLAHSEVCALLRGRGGIQSDVDPDGIERGARTGLGQLLR